VFVNTKQRLASNCPHALCTAEMCQGSRDCWQGAQHYVEQSQAPECAQIQR